MVDVSDMLKECGTQLQGWNKHCFGNVQSQLSKAQRTLSTLYERDPDFIPLEELNVARDEVQIWLERNEIMWRQRSKAMWLKEGDNNTKYFCMKASQRNQKILILKIQDDVDQWQKRGQRDRVILDYFQNLFSSSSPSVDADSLAFLEPLARKVSTQMNMDLMKVFGADEVKKKCAVKMGDYRPVNLCNVTYKLIAKVLSNRLKVVLPSIISESHSAFVPGRLITDKVLIAYELVNFLKHKKKGKEGFMSLKLDISKAYDWAEWSGVLRAPNINHLPFADDSVIFYRANVEENKRVQKLLEKYEVVSGQRINKEKTAMVFSDNVRAEILSETKQLWSHSEVQQYEKYLGLPSIVGRSKQRAFQSIKRRELESLMSRFWWGQKGNERKIYWLSWNKLCQKKMHGGLGFKDLKIFNLALLAKQGWRLLQDDSSLLHRLQKVKYFPHSSFMIASLGKCPSYTWRGIWEARKLLEAGCRWRIGNGKSVDIWKDTWIPGHTSLLSEGEWKGMV
ncbi:hypothetical protein F2P56_022622 [Juglans regia]|uniref:Reverse transcriptase domain-containing protein n=1 Tax=Juglans regia TaxID=51240 RepID=A0A833U091_JUGRE|nr:hypothetical protein F2P56_022622 [Juglans regia]